MNYTFDLIGNRITSTEDGENKSYSSDIVNRDWVKGEQSYFNYLMSGKAQHGLSNKFAPYSSGEVYVVPESQVVPPKEFLFGFIKRLFGQRQIGE